MTERTKARLAWLWLALPILGVVELGAQLWCEHRAPRFQEYARLHDILPGLTRPGDLVVVAPHWAEPMVRRAVGDAVMPVEMVARSDSAHFERVVEVSLLGQHAPESNGLTATDSRTIGPFEIRTLVNPSPEREVYDFADHLTPPNVSVFGADPPIECKYSNNAFVSAGGLGGHPTFPSKRFLCPGGEYFNVGVTVIADEKFLPRRCIWSHPLAKGQLVSKFTHVPLGERIVGHSGMYWIIERPLSGAPIDLEIAVDGEVVGQIEHRDGQGWAPFEVPLGSHEKEEDATVEFRVSSPNYANRHFCFEASSR